MMKNNGVKLFVIGVLLVGLSFYVDSPWSYDFHTIREDGIWENWKVVLVQNLIGANVRIDIFFNPLGYLFMFLGANMLHSSGKFLYNVKVFSIVGAVANLVKIGFPLVVSQDKTFYPVIACIVIELAALLISLRSFMLACKKQVDNYLYMELGKDLTFAVELYGFAVVFSFFAQILVMGQFFFAKVIYMLLTGVSWLAIIYYAWKVVAYSKKLKLFMDKEDE